jgi:hypothetical protein
MKVCYQKDFLLFAADTISFNQDFWDYDGISLTGNPYYSPDTISFTGSRLPGGLG